MEKLEKYFDVAFGAEDGVKKLRELILNLAMRGLLVNTEENKGDLNGIKSYKSESQKETPFEIPFDWKWVKLGDICDINGGFAFKSSNYVNEGVRVIRISDFDERGFKNDKIVRYTYNNTLGAFELSTNNILMAMTGGTVGKSLLVRDIPEKMVVNQRVATIKPNKQILPMFLHFGIQSDFIQQKIQSLKNSTNDNISMSDIKGFPIPLPSVQLQSVIVSKINELMSRCDDLEKLRAERDQKRLDVHTAAIRKLLDAPDQATFDDSWQFITRHFSDLYTVRENVAVLRKAILQLAVMGKLVPQDSKEGTARELLEEIEREKRKMVKEGKIKESKSMYNIKLDEIPYEIPRSWVWSKLHAIVDVRDGTHDTPKYVVAGYPLVTSKNLYGGTLDFGNIKYISKKDHEKISERSKVSKGDILFAMIGSIGNPAIVKTDLEFSIKNMALFKTSTTSFIYQNYLLNFLIHAQNKIRELSSGAVQNFVSLSFLRNYPIPLPPKEEQIRISNRIAQLINLCDNVDHQIYTLENKQEEVLGAVMAEVN